MLIGDFLEDLQARGVYAVEMLEIELPRFGFDYDRSTDRLAFLDRTVVACSVGEVRRRMAESEGGTVNDSSPGAPLVDALAISQAVFRLLFPGRTPWGRDRASREWAFAQNLAAIRFGVAGGAWQQSSALCRYFCRLHCAAPRTA